MTPPTPAEAARSEAPAPTAPSATAPATAAAAPPLPPAPFTAPPVPAAGAGPEPDDPAADRATPTVPAGGRTRWQAVRHRLGTPPRGPLLLGLVGTVLMMIGGFGAGGVLRRDPILSNSVLGFWRYGHGLELANVLVYLGLGLLALAWIRLGRDVLGGRVGGRAVLTCAVVWMIPLLVVPPLFTRDIFSYLAQGGLPLAGFDPYAVGPEALPGIFTDNVHYFWQDTPAPYGPLFILLAKAVAWLAGGNIILGVLLMRLALLPGLVLLIWALPELTHRLGGRVSVALWVAVANPLMVVHMVGGGHNDLLVMGLLATGAVVALRGRPAAGIALVTLAMAVKASAGIALPFLVLVWAAQATGRMGGTPVVRIVKAAAAGIGVFVVVFGAASLAAGVGLGWLPALSAPSMIVNWMSIPTAVGQISHLLVSIVVDVPVQPFINTTRIIGGVILLAFAATQWWAARDGGPDAVRRAGWVLLAVAVLSPAMLPWYVSWGLALVAATAWPARRLAVAVFLSLMLVIVYYPNGEDALDDWFYLIGCGLVALLAAVSLIRPDPLRLSAQAWADRRARPTAGADRSGA